MYFGERVFFVSDHAVTGFAACAFFYTRAYAIDIFSVWCTLNRRLSVVYDYLTTIYPELILPCVPRLYWVKLNFAKFVSISDLVVFATRSSCFACATLYAEVKRKKKKEVDVLLVLLCRDPSNLCKIHNKNCVTKTWCWINGRVTRSLSRPLVQRYLTAELCSLSSLFVSLERAFSGSIYRSYYTQYAFNWNFSKTA